MYGLIPNFRSFGLNTFILGASKVYVVSYSSKIRKIEAVFYLKYF